MTADLLDTLIDSQALRIAPPGEVFWYTSGTLGPYYVNTHYLFGGPDAAEELLTFIDSDSRAVDFHAQLSERISLRLDSDAAFRRVIDALVAAVRARPGAGDLDWISGGERRDWFFSLPVAMRMDLPHLYVYKDGGTFLPDGGAGLKAVDDLSGRRTAHITDLVTEASSYAGVWIPSIRDRGGEMLISANVIDRAQGGMDVIDRAGVDALALLRVDAELFGDLLQRKMIDAQQHAVLLDYFGDPTGAMKRFLEATPDFLDGALASADERTAKRARMLVDNDPYSLGLSG
ncbi:MAG TPA: orotate phosphoribosyltransferase [Candidatus Latescibacteria bacterium]|nr:orotate phosphoribosyltransferase [Candidatus Latescibacterota bacterium]